jgi:hypothetical protein
MNRLEIRSEERMGSRTVRILGRQTVTSVPGHGRVGPAVRGFGGRDGRDGGALLAGAAALGRLPVPAGRDPPTGPGGDRADPHRRVATPPPAPVPPQAPHHHPLAGEPSARLATQLGLGSELLRPACEPLRPEKRTCSPSCRTRSVGKANPLRGGTEPTRPD